MTKYCKGCKEKDILPLYYLCRKRNWLIDKKLGNKQRLCDDEND